MTNLCSLCGRCSEKCPVKIPLAELIRDLRSERVGQGRMKIVGYHETQRDVKEQKMMQQFSKAATNGFKWRMAFKMIHIFSPLLRYVTPFSFVQKSMLGKWLQNHELPTLNGNLHAKVKKMKGVIYE